MSQSEDVTTWLLAGDPVIRWQAMRDLADAPAEEWQAERRGTLTEGWGAAFLDAMDADDKWPPGRWTDTVWTLLLVMDCGIPAEHPRLHKAARQFIDTILTPERAKNEKRLLTRMDLCHLGFWLRIGSYFLGADPRLRLVGDFVLGVQMDDGGWNCQIPELSGEAALVVQHDLQRARWAP